MAIAGGTGGMTLSRINEYGSLACWVIGVFAGLCTIHSWLEKRKIRKAKKR